MFFFPRYDSHQVADDDPLRANHSLPPGFRITLSSIPGVGMGVFSDIDVPVGVVFGPYEGVKVTGSSPESIDGDYCWEIIINNRLAYCIDGKDLAHSNYMRYVNCANNFEEQNLFAFQFRRKVFYRTIKEIEKGSELLVWYGDTFGRSLGLDTMQTEPLAMSPALVENFDLFSESDDEAPPILRDESVVQFQKVDRKKAMPLLTAEVDRITTESRVQGGVLIRPKSYVCPKCGLAFKRMDGLKRHIMVHKIAILYTCQACSHQFYDYRHYLDHRKLLKHKGMLRKLVQFNETPGQPTRNGGQERGHADETTVNGVDDGEEEAMLQLESQLEIDQPKFEYDHAVTNRKPIRVPFRPHWCDKCPRRYSSSDRLWLHRSRCHGIRKSYVGRVVKRKCFVPCKPRKVLRSNIVDDVMKSGSSLLNEDNRKFDFGDSELDDQTTDDCGVSLLLPIQSDTAPSVKIDVDISDAQENLLPKSIPGVSSGRIGTGMKWMWPFTAVAPTEAVGLPDSTKINDGSLTEEMAQMDPLQKQNLLAVVESPHFEKSDSKLSQSTKRTLQLTLEDVQKLLSRVTDDLQPICPPLLKSVDDTDIESGMEEDKIFPELREKSAYFPELKLCLSEDDIEDPDYCKSSFSDNSAGVDDRSKTAK